MLNCLSTEEMLLLKEYIFDSLEELLDGILGSKVDSLKDKNWFGFYYELFFFICYYSVYYNILIINPRTAVEIRRVNDVVIFFS